MCNPNEVTVLLIGFYCLVIIDDSSCFQGEIDFGEFIFLMSKIRNEKASQSATMGDSEDKSFVHEFVALSYKVEAKSNVVRGRFLIYLFMFLTFTFLISTSTAAFQYFKCHEFPEADVGTRRFLYKDYSVDCDSTRYKVYVPYALLMILIYPIGIPLFYWLMLSKKKHVLSDEEAVMREASADFPTIGHLTFLTQAYKSKYYYFEVLECVRRLMLASVIGMLPADGVVAPTLGILLCFVFLYVFIDFRPYRNADDSNLGVILQYSITLLFLAGLLTKVNVTTSMTPSEAAIFGYVLMVILLLGPFMSLADFLKSLLLRRKVQIFLKEELHKEGAAASKFISAHQLRLESDDEVANFKSAPTTALTRKKQLEVSRGKSISLRVASTIKDVSQPMTFENPKDGVLLASILDRLEAMGYKETASTLKREGGEALSRSVTEDNIDVADIVRKFETLWGRAFEASSKSASISKPLGTTI